MKLKNNAISFEFFPPKTSVGIEKLAHTAKTLAQLKPGYFSVTYGAGGSTRSGTIDTVRLLQESTDVPVAPHLSCVAAKVAEIETILQQYQALNIKRIVALRGDLPSGMGNYGEFQYATELVTLIRKQMGPDFVIEVAAYPETHPRSACCNSDIEYFKKKVDAGASGAITQYFYNVDAYYDFMDRARKANITIPITPGIMPIHNFSSLVRFSNNCGADVPRWLIKRLEGFKDDTKAMREFSIEFTTRLCQQLIELGAPGLHFYSLNNAEQCYAIAKNIIEED